MKKLCTICARKETKGLKNKNLLNNKIGYLIMPRLRSIDIDDDLDFLFQKKLWKKIL